MSLKSEPAITVNSVSKKFVLGAIGAATLREQLGLQLDRLLGRATEQKQDFWALRNINFRLEKGEVLGIIGKNGSGKSTLLKILSKITGPTEGRIEINGKLSSLLEVGTGFHPELTGRENIFLNGSILGMTRNEVESQFEQIVAFAGIRPFIDTPVKRYSSGMYVRLAFAVAAHLQPEILIVDEVLAVGDYDFQKKCIGKMNEVANSGRSVIFVSHNMGAVSELCSRVLILNQGQIAYDGSVDEGIRQYISETRNFSGSISLTKEQIGEPALSNSYIKRAWCENKNGSNTSEFAINQSFRIGVEYVAQNIQGYTRVSIVIYRNSTPVFTSFSDDDELLLRNEGEQIVYLEIQSNFLKAGDYSAEIYISQPVFKSPLALNFSIQENNENVFHKGYRRDRLGVVIAQAQWKTSSAI